MGYQARRQGRKRRFSLSNRGGETMKKIRFDEDHKEHDESNESMDIQGEPTTKLFIVTTRCVTIR